MTDTKNGTFNGIADRPLDPRDPRGGEEQKIKGGDGNWAATICLPREPLCGGVARFAAHCCGPRRAGTIKMILR
jgi:hypothetical protein